VKDLEAIIAEADGSEEEAARVRAELKEALGEGSERVYAPRQIGAVGDLWRWREGVTLAVTAARGAKLSEDIAVPASSSVSGPPRRLRRSGRSRRRLTPRDCSTRARRSEARMVRACPPRS